MIDTDVMGRLLRHLEADIHRRGWDQDPQLLVLYAWREGDSEQAYRRAVGRFGDARRMGPYAARPAVPKLALTGSAAHCVFRMALNLAGAADHPSVQVVVSMLRQPGFLGIALVSEGWQVNATPEERDALGDVRFADLSESRETRQVNATTIDGQDYWVARTRGDKPRFDLSCPGKAELGGAGRCCLRVAAAHHGRYCGAAATTIDRYPSGLVVGRSAHCPHLGR